MTNYRIALESLIEKAPDADFLREMIAVAAKRLMALEVDGFCGAGHGERNAAKVLGATWQRCRVHFMRNALAHVTKGQRPMVAAASRTAFAQESHQAATNQWRQIVDSLRKRFPALRLLPYNGAAAPRRFVGEQETHSEDHA